VTQTYYGFKKQFSEEYTKAVFKEFRKKLKKSTLFRVQNNKSSLQRVSQEAKEEHTI
jgi:hypothetical protein